MRPRRWPLVVAALLVVLAPTYWWLFLESGEAPTTFHIDLAEVRRLANSMPGEKPGDVRGEAVAHFTFPKTAVMAGDGWALADMTVYAWQLVFPDRRLVIDTAMDAKTAKEGGASAFDDAAFAHVTAALSDASTIVVTHEHFDHLAGLGTHPDVKALMAKALLTKEQLAEPARMDPLVFPADALRAYRPLEAGALHAVAPGVVLIKAPGHTPGSQLVYVQRTDGRELLFLGDVAWHLRNVEHVRERARLVTKFFLNEDREAVLSELAELHRLTRDEPGLTLVPGHDATVVDALFASGLVTKGLLTAAPPPPAPPAAVDAGAP